MKCCIIFHDRKTIAYDWINEIAAMTSILKMVPTPKSMFLYRFRDCQFILHSIIHPGDVPENVQFRLPRIFCVTVQSIWLFCCHMLSCWGHIHIHGHHAAPRGVRAPLCQITTSVQIHQVGHQAKKTIAIDLTKFSVDSTCILCYYLLWFRHDHFWLKWPLNLYLLMSSFYCLLV